LAERMATSPRGTASARSNSPRKFDKLASMIISDLKQRECTASDAKKAFEASFTEKIPLSTVSTYLVRLVERGVLDRTETGRNVSYRVKTEESRPILSLRP